MAQEPSETDVRAILLPPLALALLLSGCLQWSGHSEGFGPDFEGTAQVREARAEGAYDPFSLRTRVRVDGVVGLTDVTEGDVDVYLAAGSCPVGPTGQPSDYADHVQVAVRGAAGGSAPFRATLEAPSVPGAPHAVYVVANPAPLGPNFATCLQVAAASPV